MRRKCLLMFLFIVIYSINACAQKTLSLKECIETGIENNLLLKNSEQDIRKAKYTISENRAKLLPVINAFGNFNNNVDPASTLLDGSANGIPYIESRMLRYSTSGGAQLSLPLYNQTLYTSIRIAEKIKEIKEYSYEKAKEDLIIEISKLYYLSQTTTEQIKLTRDNIDRLTKLKNITQAFHDNDMALNVDIKRVDIDLENMQVQYDNAIAILEQQMNLLKYILDIPSETDVRLTDLKTTDSEIFVLLSGVSPDLNELKILCTKNEVLEKQKQSIKQGYLPSLSFVGQLAYTNYTDRFSNYFHSDCPANANHWNNNFYWGLSLKIPIFDGFDKKIKTGKVKVDIIQNQLEIADIQKKLDTQYKNGINEWTNNKRTYQRQKDNYRLAEDVYDVTADQYKEGVAPMSDLLQDEMRMSDAQNNYLNAYYNCKISELNLLKLTKQLDFLTK